MRPITVLVASHKAYSFPDDNGYLPIHVGKSTYNSDLGLLGDNSGVNISYKNATYCELTALFWAWKNLETEYLGMVHYRRYFKACTNLSPSYIGSNAVASSMELYSYICEGQADIILPRKRYYLIDSIESHYINAHYEEDLNIIKTIIGSDYPAYTDSLNKVLASRSASMFNMFFTKKTIADAYSSWLFELLSLAERKIDLSGRSPFQQRVYGFLAEILLNVWVDHHKLAVKRLPVVHLEGENLFHKAFELILRKLNKNRKYDT